MTRQTLLAAALLLTPTLALAEGGYIGISALRVDAKLQGVTSEPPVPANVRQDIEFNHPSALLLLGYRLNPHWAIELRGASATSEDTVTMQTGATEANTGEIDWQIKNLHGIYFKLSPNASRFLSYVMLGYTQVESYATNATPNADGAARITSGGSVSWGAGLEYNLHAASIGIEYMDYYEEQDEATKATGLGMGEIGGFSIGIKWLF